MTSIKRKIPASFRTNFETYRGLEKLFLIFPVAGSPGIDKSFQKVLRKRLDGCLFAQRRSRFRAQTRIAEGNSPNLFQPLFDDVIIVPKGPSGEETNRILSEALRTLRADGRLEAPAPENPPTVPGLAALIVIARKHEIQYNPGPNLPPKSRGDQQLEGLWRGKAIKR